MRLMIAIAVIQIGVLTAPDPAQMENAPDLGYVPVANALILPQDIRLGAPAAVALNAQGHLLVFNRGAHPLIEFDADSRFIRSFGEGLYTRAHGMRIDRDGNIWTTDVNGHTVTKMDPRGQVLLSLGVKGQRGDWNEAAQSRLLNEPNDVAFGPAGEIFIVEGHGQAVSRVLKLDRNGTFIRTWGGAGTGPGQFDVAHSIVIDATGLVYVADRQNRRVQMFDLDGTFVREWKFAGLPCGLVIGPDRQIYLTTGFSGQILRLDANGKAVAATGQPGKGLGEFGEAHYMAFGPKREIYVADTINATLHKFVIR